MDTSRSASLLTLVGHTDLPAPIIVPVSGGALSIIWTVGAKEVKFSVYPGAEGMFFVFEDDEIIRDGQLDLARPASIREQISWMMRP